MGKAPLEIVRDHLMPLFVVDPVERALRVSAGFVALGAIYADLLVKRIFPHPLVGVDKKDLLKFQKCLQDEEALRILLIIWKESPHLTDTDLRRADLRREFDPGSLNAWNMATTTSTAADLAKTNSRIRSTTLAAEAFGLVERSVAGTRRPLVATDLLHQFILELTGYQFDVFSEVAGRLSPPITDPNP